MAFETHRKEHHLELHFAAPQAANAFSLTDARELKKLVRAHAKWSRPVVVRAPGARVFCAGGNLRDYARLTTKSPGLKINREITAALDAFARWPVPKLAVVEGDVLGGGMEWLGRFDFRWCTTGAAFSFWQRRIGLAPGWGGGKPWAAILGEPRLRVLLMEARLIGAHEAAQLGLVDRVLPAWRLEEKVAAWSATLDGLADWSVKREAAVFRKLWMADKHRRALARWT